jgi:hypothetical protein
LVNGMHLCDWHHDLVHFEGWTLVKQEDGTIKAYGPNDPENPRRGIPPEEYRRMRDEAIFNRRRKKAAPAPRPEARAGPLSE